MRLARVCGKSGGATKMAVRAVELVGDLAKLFSAVSMTLPPRKPSWRDLARAEQREREAPGASRRQRRIVPGARDGEMRLLNLDEEYSLK